MIQCFTASLAPMRPGSNNLGEPGGEPYDDGEKERFGYEVPMPFALQKFRTLFVQRRVATSTGCLILSLNFARSHGTTGMPRRRLHVRLLRNVGSIDTLPLANFDSLSRCALAQNHAQIHPRSVDSSCGSHDTSATARRLMNRNEAH